MAAESLLPEMLRWLDGHTNLEADGSIRRPKLDTIRSLLQTMGDPQERYPIIHVTGTNGKTSTSRLTAHILSACGLRVGCYVSPHLTSVNERISCGGAPISDDELGQALASVAKHQRRSGRTRRASVSYFEILTAVAFNWFAERAVDCAVIEVGLGGAWDATNVARGKVAVVTNIGLDHTEYLGPTRMSIATEKAGIIKPGATLVLGESDPGLAQIFQTRGAARVFRMPTDFAVLGTVPCGQGQLVDLRTPQAYYRDLLLPLHGPFQADNAILSVVAAESFLARPVPSNALGSALTSFETPGRMEVLRRHPLVVLDGAHNVAGAETLIKALNRDFPTDCRTLVVGMLLDKDARGILETLIATSTDRLVLCPVQSPRSRDPEDLAALALAVGVNSDRIHIASSVMEGLRHALRHIGTEGQILVTGSLYAVAEARNVLLGGRAGDVDAA